MVRLADTPITWIAVKKQGQSYKISRFRQDAGWVPSAQQLAENVIYIDVISDSWNDVVAKVDALGGA